MAEGISARVARIVGASLNALVDAVEDASPELVMQQAIREVDLAIDDVRNELGRILARKHVAAARLLDENRRHEELAEKIALALPEGRDDLAEAAIGRQLDIEAQTPVIDRAIAECAEREAELEGFVAALLARRREMRDELRQFAEARSGAAADPTAVGSDARGGADTRADRARSAFDEVLARNVGVVGAATDIRTAKKLAELDDLARSHAVRARLADAKARLATS